MGYCKHGLAAWDRTQTFQRDCRPGHRETMVLLVTHVDTCKKCTQELRAQHPTPPRTEARP